MGQTINEVVNSIPVGKSPGNSPNGIGINSINNTVYTIDTGSNTVSVINGITTKSKDISWDSLTRRLYHTTRIMMGFISLTRGQILFP